MNTKNTSLSFELLLKSLETDFDKEERNRILEQLKNSEPTDEALLGAKLLLEENNWDYTVLKNAFQKTNNKVIAKSHQPTKSRFSIVKYAAVLIPIGLAIVYFVFFDAKKLDDFYLKDAGLPHFMSPKKTNWESLMQPYRAGKMDIANDIAEKILIQKPVNDTALYFQGVIHYELKDFEKAKLDFEKVSKNNQSVFYYDALFRLGFALEKTNDKNRAFKQFNLIAKDSTNPYKYKAKAILDVVFTD